MQQVHSSIALIVLNGDERGRIIVVNDLMATVLGRGEDADVQLSASDLRLSRRHARLEPNSNGWTLSTVPGATNQPCVSGATGDRLVLTDGAEIRLGDTLLRVSLGAIDSCWRCEECDADLSRDANSDGRAIELNGLVGYRCDKHVQRDVDLASRTIAHYQLCSLLGRGGAGVVYRAYDMRTRRIVALKQLIDLRKIELVRRFDQEIAALMKLRHINIVRFVDCGVDSSGTPYLVTEYAPDGNVGDLAQHYSFRVPIRAAVDIVCKVLDALRFIHKHDIIHRDIKPENVLVRRCHTRGGEVEHIPKVADFGLLKQVDGIRLTKPNDASGSFEFMPPEQPLNFSKLDVRADIYSLGATLYFMLTGRLPLELREGTADDETIRQVIAADRIPIRERVPDIPERLAIAIDQACHKDASRRFESADAFQNALHEAL